MIGSFFMTIFVLAPPEFYLRNKCHKRFDAKSHDFEMAVKSTFLKGKVSMIGRIKGLETISPM